jgi:hypothetical protein
MNLMHWGDQPIQNRIVGSRIIDPGHFDGTTEILDQNGKISENLIT